MSTETELLTTLRDAARRRDWNGCRDATEAALSRLPVPTILRIAHQEIQRRLPLFERQDPHMRWPRVWLDALATESPGTLDETTPEVLEDSPEPGANGFREAVMQLALAAAAAADRTQCLKHAMEAIAGVIMAEGSETLGTEHREVWDLWYQDGLNVMNGGERLHPGALVPIMKDPKVAAVELAAWNRLADELSVALSAAGS